jgi:hypothetical protein
MELQRHVSAPLWFHMTESQKFLNKHALGQSFTLKKNTKSVCVVKSVLRIRIPDEDETTDFVIIIRVWG